MAGIVMKSRKVVVHTDCDGEASWLRSLVEVWPTQIVDQWMDWITNTSSGVEVPTIDWIIAVLPSTKKTVER